MMERDPEFLNEEEAARLWQRAAELQAEAARNAKTPEAKKPDVHTPGRHALTHVRSAAVEAGIANEFVDAALADLRVERELPKGKGGQNLARRFFAILLDTITVRRVIHASSSHVLTTMESVLPAEPYRLTLADQLGDPLDGGVLVFDIQGFGTWFPQGLAREAAWSALRKVYVSLRPIEGAEPSCEVTLRGPIAWSHNIGLAQGVVVTGIGGGIGLGLGVIGSALVGLSGLGPLAAVGAGGLMLGSLVLGGELGRRGFLALGAYGIGRGTRALERLLGAIAARAQGGFRTTQVRGDEAPAQLGGVSAPTD